MVSIYEANIRANELRDAANNLTLAIRSLENAINNLNSGASAQRIKTAASNLNRLKNDISPKINTLNTLADRIVNTAYQIQREEQNY